VENLLWIVLGGIALLVVVVVVWWIATYNGLVGKRNETKNAWSQIDVQLKRRYDLIPNLVETAKGYMAHERETLEAVIAARNRAHSAEAYPDLKANQNMAQLQEELASTENRIAFARQAYNDAVMTYNTRREQFPDSIVANSFNFTAAELWQLENAEARQAPRVSFGNR